MLLPPNNGAIIVVALFVPLRLVAQWTLDNFGGAYVRWDGIFVVVLWQIVPGRLDY